MFVCQNFYCRFKREEMKIQAWENHQIRKAEMEMKKMEVHYSLGLSFSQLSIGIIIIIMKFIFPKKISPQFLNHVVVVWYCCGITANDFNFSNTVDDDGSYFHVLLSF